MIVLGVDPGLTGAITAICSLRGLIECADLPASDNGLDTGSMKRWVDVGLLRSLLAAWSLRHDFARDDVCAVIERPIPMPTLPAQTIGSQFDSFGTIRGVLGCMLKPDAVHVISTHEWKRSYGLKNDKDAARELAQRLYPDGHEHFKRVRDHNRAESCLIARYWLRSVA